MKIFSPKVRTIMESLYLASRGKLLVVGGSYAMAKKQHYLKAVSRQCFWTNKGQIVISSR